MARQTSKRGLDNILQRKGAATPATDGQRGAAEKRHKSVTLRLSPEEYRRLRLYAAKTDQTHQDIIKRLLMDMLDREGA